MNKYDIKKLDTSNGFSIISLEDRFELICFNEDKDKIVSQRQFMTYKAALTEAILWKAFNS